ncbi:MAG: response regulator [Chryseolinea sp.]
MSPIILIDDDIDDLETLVTAFHDMDPALTCVTFSDCTVALSHLNDETTPQPACIFVDMHLPKIDGPDCLKAIRGISRLANVPVAMISDAFRESDVETLKDLGANFLFYKSHNVGQYHEIINTIMNQSFSNK